MTWILQKPDHTQALNELTLLISFSISHSLLWLTNLVCFFTRIICASKAFISAHFFSYSYKFVCEHSPAMTVLHIVCFPLPHQILCIFVTTAPSFRAVTTQPLWNFAFCLALLWAKSSIEWQSKADILLHGIYLKLICLLIWHCNLRLKYSK